VSGAREGHLTGDVGVPGPGRPADECPYPKPFPPDFSDCSAYRAAEFTALDMQFKPLAPVVTCQHLVRGTIESGGARAYARCLLGSAEERARWVERVRPERLRVIGQLADELRELLRPHILAMWEAKGALLRGDRGQEATSELDAAMNAVIADCDRVIDANEARMAELGLPAAPVKLLVRRAVADWRQNGERVYRLEMSDEMLSQFPPDVRELLRPRQP
jgi:hypothetical protein